MRVKLRNVGACQHAELLGQGPPRLLPRVVLRRRRRQPTLAADRVQAVIGGEADPRACRDGRRERRLDLASANIPKFDPLLLRGTIVPRTLRWTILELSRFLAKFLGNFAIVGDISWHFRDSKGLLGTSVIFSEIIWHFRAFF